MSSKTDDDDIDESAIDDDKSSDWEDTMEYGAKSSVNGKPSFPRMDSRRKLTSCRSLITTMLYPDELQSAVSKSIPALLRSHTSSPQGPSVAPSVEPDDSVPLRMKSRMRPGQVPRSGAQLITMTTTNVTPHQAALSPKTTGRQMLANELTASLRRHQLWEHKQTNQTASAVLKRRHTAHNVKRRAVPRQGAPRHGGQGRPRKLEPVLRPGSRRIPLQGLVDADIARSHRIIPGEYEVIRQGCQCPGMKLYRTDYCSLNFSVLIACESELQSTVVIPIYSW